MTAGQGAHHQGGGRDVPPLETFTCSNGSVIRLRPVSQWTRQQFRTAYQRQNPPPVPPLNVVDMGNGAESVPNPHDPAYVQALQAYNDELAVAAVDFVLIMGCETTVDPDALAAAKARAARASRGLLTLEGDDHELYLKHVVLADERDAQQVFARITRQSQPTEEAIQEAVDTFRSDV